MRLDIGDNAIELVQGDITLQEVDAIVNAANAALAGGGGVDGAIHRAGGPRIMAECRALGGCPTGNTVATTAGNLRAKRVLHTVGPVWRGGKAGEAESLASCYQSALELAAREKLATIAFPSVSTGVYRYPVEQAAAIAIGTVAAFLKESDAVRLARFVLFDEHTYSAYARALGDISP